MSSESGGDAPCWLHLLDEEGQIAESATPSVRVDPAAKRPSEHDGYRVLVDREWPGRIPRDDAFVDDWFPELSPSDRLIRWYDYDRARWQEFMVRYWDELNTPAGVAAVATLTARALSSGVTLITASPEPDRSHAEVLRQLIASRRAPKDR